MLKQTVYNGCCPGRNGPYITWLLVASLRPSQKQQATGNGKSKRKRKRNFKAAYGYNQMPWQTKQVKSQTQGLPQGN